MEMNNYAEIAFNDFNNNVRSIFYDIHKNKSNYYLLIPPNEHHIPLLYKKQKEFYMSYSKKRYFVYTLLTLFIMVLPFIKINDNHILLLSFDKLQFHFLGSVYSVSELYVMPFLLMFLFIGIFALTSMFGRIWCGWSCPQTIFRVIYRDLIEGTILDLRRIKNKQKDINYNKYW